MNNKFLSRTYAMRFTLKLTNPKGSVGFAGISDGDFDARCVFSGMTSVDAVYFKVLKGNKKAVRELLEVSAITEAIISVSRKVVIARIDVRYDSVADVLSIDIAPYAGAYVWIKFPPFSRAIPLRPEELRAIASLTGVFRSQFGSFER
jgi:hypothetical protein